MFNGRQVALSHPGGEEEEDICSKYNSKYYFEVMNVMIALENPSEIQEKFERQ